MTNICFPAFATTLLCAVIGCKGSQSSQKPEPAAKAEAEAELTPASLQMFGALPEVFESKDNPLTKEKIDLGRMLFYENRLSLSRELSCNSCHSLTDYGVDGKRVSEGHKKQPGKRNANTVYNAAGQFAQFWDGRAATIEEQAKGPILNPIEMAMPTETTIIADVRLESIPEYVEAFKKAFPAEKNPVSFNNLAKAIGAFERKLVTPTRWHKFLKGDTSALTKEEKNGAKLFVDTGCPTCHMGPLIGGSMFQKLGLMQPWPGQADLGRYEVTKADADKMFFKVPSLLNVEKTGPYFHDGSVTKLEEAVKMMAKHQLGRTLDDKQTASIVSFLKTLTGTIPNDYIKKPTLPPDGKNTPKAVVKRG